MINYCGGDNTNDRMGNDIMDVICNISLELILCSVWNQIDRYIVLLKLWLKLSCDTSDDYDEGSEREYDNDGEYVAQQATSE